MSNRVDFFQPKRTKLAIPSATVLINLDGMACPVLELVEIVRAGWPEFSRARLAYNLASYQQDNLLAIEDVETRLSIGKSINICQIYNDSAPAVAAEGLPIFVGRIEAIDSKLTSTGEIVEVVARDFGAELQRITIYGQRVRNLDGSTLFLAGQDTNFNENRQPNAATEKIDRNGRSYTVFSADRSSAGLWSYAQIIDYLLSEYLSVGQLCTPDINQLEALTDNQRAGDFDVTGLNLLQALHRCCEDTGLKFKFVPRLSSGEPGEAVVFYKDGFHREVELNCQPKGQKLSISKTAVAALTGRRNCWPVTHRYIGQGDFKIYEATFDFIKAWAPADEDTDYDKFSPSANPEFYKVKDVFRKWSLNEAGDYNGSPYNAGDAFDFSKIFDGDNFVHQRRRFRPALTTDKQNNSLGYFLEVSFDDGANWRQYLYAFNNLLDECGVWLSSDRLDVDTWVAAIKGKLKFRITASVVSDERLNCRIADGPVGAVVPVVEHVITLPRRFKYRKVSGQSIFANSTDPSLGQPDEVDDTTALYDFVRRQALSGTETIETIDVQTPYLAFDYQVGDKVVSSPESRDLFNTRSDNRSNCRIKKIQMDFQKQCTNLEIIRQRKVWL